jgi:nicotinate-nucleotide--dimethylbenzimidazole phosphoribosyltransferase
MNLTKGIVSTKNPALEKVIQSRLDDLTKPQGSLGRLEEFVLRYCLCRGNANAKLTSMQMFTFAGDHGITDEKVAPYPKEVTTQMVMNMVNGGAAISVMCKNAGIDYFVVDMGVDAQFDKKLSALIDRKVAKGTQSFLKNAAMTKSQCEKALMAGYNLAVESGAGLLGVGEMGIGNTSSASALYSLLLDITADKTVGAGTGAAGSLLLHKKQVIKQAVAFHRKTWDGSGFDALRRVGGFEIAGIAGMILGAAKKRVPVVVDGFISSAAALVAMEMNPVVKDYLFFAHESSEKFHRELLDALSERPILNLGMRLGEGTGAALAMHIIWQAMNCYHQMATFSKAKVSKKEAV